VITFDVNVLVHAYVESSYAHAVCLAAVDDIRAKNEPLVLSHAVTSGFIRIVSNSKLLKPVVPIAEAFLFINVLRAHPGYREISPGARHWRIFQELVEQTGISGPDVSDAWFAALAIEHGLEWWTTDLDFKRFEGLRWRHLTA